MTLQDVLLCLEYHTQIISRLKLSSKDITLTVSLNKIKKANLFQVNNGIS